MRTQDAKHYLGMEVVYQGTGEHGVIQDANETYVFVLYLGDRVAKATHAEDLVFANPLFQESYERSLNA